MELRELLMAETTASGIGVDPARITLAARRLLPGASGDRDKQVTVPQPWKWNSPPGRGRGRPEPAVSRSAGHSATQAPSCCPAA